MVGARLPVKNAVLGYTKGIHEKQNAA